MKSEAPAILSVDWESAGRTPPLNVQKTVEYYGSKHAGKYTDDTFPEEWKPGGEKWGVLSQIIDEHGSWSVPGHGELDQTYANLISTSGLQEALRAYRGDSGVLDRFPLLVPLDPALKTRSTTPAAVPGAGIEIDEGAASRTSEPNGHEYSLPNTDFGEELHELVSAAAHIDKTIGDFVDPAPNADRVDGRPAVRSGQYGPDCLGNLYIMFCVEDSIQELPIDDYPVSVEDTQSLNNREGKEITLRHERYVEIPWASEPWGERTHGFFDQLSNRANFVEAASFHWVGDDLDEMIREQTGLVPAEDSVEFPPNTGKEARVYEPPLEIDSDEDLQWLTLLPSDDQKQPIGVYTDSPPTSEDVLLSALIVDIQSAFRSGDARAVFECRSCSEWTHWLGSLAVSASPSEILDRIDYAHSCECGCDWSPQD